MEKMPWNIVRHLFYWFFPAQRPMIPSLRHRPIPSILKCGHEWKTMQPDLLLTNVCGLDLDMAMLDVLNYLHAYPTSVTFTKLHARSRGYRVIWCWWSLPDQSRRSYKDIVERQETGQTPLIVMKWQATETIDRLILHNLALNGFQDTWHNGIWDLSPIYFRNSSETVSQSIHDNVYLERIDVRKADCFTL